MPSIKPQFKYTNPAYRHCYFCKEKLTALSSVMGGLSIPYNIGINPEVTNQGQWITVITDKKSWFLWANYLNTQYGLWTAPGVPVTEPSRHFWDCDSINSLEHSFKKRALK